MRRIAALVVGSVPLMIVAALECSGPKEVPDAAADVVEATLDVPPKPDAGSCLAPNANDEPPASFWLTPGWQRVGAPLACCAAAIAMKPVDVVPPLKWIPCKNGVPECVEDEVTWGGGSYFFMDAVVSRDANGVPRLLKFKRQEAEKQQNYLIEDDVYDFASGTPSAALRSAILRQADICVIGLTIGVSSIALLSRTKLSDSHNYVGWSSLPLSNLQHQPITGSLETMLNAKNPAIPQYPHMSPTSLAFGLVLGGSGFVRFPVGSASYIRSQGTYPDGEVEEIEGDVVFANSFYGTDGWSQEYVMAPDGTVRLLRGKDKTHVSVMRTDGKTLFWVESYGLPDPHIAPGDFIPQPNMEVWFAPYTSDPLVLASTAKKLTTVASHTRTFDAVAFGGVYAFTTDTKVITVVREKGGLVQLSSGLGRSFSEVTYVSEAEVWTVMNAWLEDAGTTGVGGVAFARYSLPDW